MHKFKIHDRGSIAKQTDRVLSLLTQNPMSVEELAKELDLTKKEVWTSLDRLERQGEICRYRGRYQVILQKTD